MRNLNLSRLARASESSFFKKEQAQQALNLRGALTDAEKEAIAKASSGNGTAGSASSASPDVLSEISAHSVYSRAIRQAASDIEHVRPTRMTTRPLLPVVDINALGVPPKRKEEKMMRALGTGKLSMYSANTATSVESRPLPGGTQYADGAVLGIASFSIASAIVASVGLAGGIVLYYNPRIIQRWKDSSIRLRQHLDSQVGGFFRRHVTARMSSSSAVSDETKHKASAFARAAVGLPTSTNSTDTQPTSPNRSS